MFRLDDDVPLPDLEDEDLKEDIELRKRGRKPRCKSNSLHVWESISKGKEKCKLCGDVFPCDDREHCWHFDCYEALGLVHPWIEDGTMVPTTPNVTDKEDLVE